MIEVQYLITKCGEDLIVIVMVMTADVYVARNEDMMVMT